MVYVLKFPKGLVNFFIYVCPIKQSSEFTLGGDGALHFSVKCFLGWISPTLLLLKPLYVTPAEMFTEEIMY